MEDQTQTQPYKVVIEALKSQRNEALDRLADYEAALMQANARLTQQAERIRELEKKEEEVENGDDA